MTNEPTIINGDLVLEQNTTYEGDLIVYGNITGKNGARYNLTVHGNLNACDVNARDVNARDVNAMDVNAWNVNARDVNACDVNARDVNARDVNAGDVNAGDISYYAVCFAYHNIKCKSIKGRRDNSKHFVLDGKIEEI